VIQGGLNLSQDVWKKGAALTAPFFCPQPILTCHPAPPFVTLNTPPVTLSEAPVLSLPKGLIPTQRFQPDLIDPTQ
jgi:hypothetical protein